jgi:hypothetical protein
VSAYKLTVRHGSNVEHERFATLDEALAAMEDRAKKVRAEGPLEDVAAIRDYSADVLVHARLELSTGRFLFGREAGIDVMGDGNLVPYVGGIRKRQLEPSGGESPFDAIRKALQH